MKVLIFLTVTAAALAAPDIGLEYRYQIPSTSYGTPISPADSSLVYPSRQYYHVDTRDSIPNAVSPVPPSTAFQTPTRGYTSFTGGAISERFGVPGTFDNGATYTGIGSSGLSGTESKGNRISTSETFTSSPGISGTGSLGSRISTSGATFTGGSGISATGSLGSRISTSGATFTGSSGATGGSVTSTGSSGFSSSGPTGFSSFDSRGSFQQQQADVQRHIYFFAAPEEQEEVRSRVNIPVVTPKKNIKIIFIKAPTYSAPAPIQIPVLPQNEEKTLVYVLVKKPDEQAQIDIPTPAPIKPSKPEVFFIKYKSQQDAQEVISNVQSGLAAGEVGANSVEGGQDFINTIRQEDISSSRDNGVSLTSLPESFDERINVVGGTDVSKGGTTSLRSGFGDGSVYSVSSGGSSTTASSLEPTNVGTGTSGSSGIHQLYGPPK